MPQSSAKVLPFCGITAKESGLSLQPGLMQKGCKMQPFRLFICGVGRDRTGDTRIFSPLLYQLSYRTSFPYLGVAKVTEIFKKQTLL